MKIYQLAVIAALAAGFLVVALVVLSDGKIDIPGLSQNMAEVKFNIERGSLGDGITILEVSTYSGLEMVSMAPLWFDAPFRVEATATYNGQIVGQAIKIVNVDWWGNKQDFVRLAIGENPHNVVILLKLVNDYGELRDTDTYTIP